MAAAAAAAALRRARATATAPRALATRTRLAPSTPTTRPHSSLAGAGRPLPLASRPRRAFSSAAISAERVQQLEARVQQLELEVGPKGATSSNRRRLDRLEVLCTASAGQIKALGEASLRQDLALRDLTAVVAKQAQDTTSSFSHVSATLHRTNLNVIEGAKASAERYIQTERFHNDTLLRMGQTAWRIVIYVSASTGAVGFGVLQIASSRSDAHNHAIASEIAVRLIKDLEERFVNQLDAAASQAVLAAEAKRIAAANNNGPDDK